MDKSSTFDSWNAGQNYDHYMGRWSRKVAGEFLTWLAPGPDLDWLELGCGTGALSSRILADYAPNSVIVTDFSEDFLSHTKNTISDTHARFQVADAQSLPFANDQFDLVVSALAFNFIPDTQKALSEMERVLRTGGQVAFYVWDYPGGGMGFIDAFWKAASAVDPAAAALDEGLRFPFCTPEGLTQLFAGSAWSDVRVDPIEIATEFESFEEFWRPFTLGAGPAPGYCKTLDERGLERLKSRLSEQVGRNGPIRLPARAWAVRAGKP